MDKEIKAVYVLADILWKRWMEMLPNSPAWMATKIIEDLKENNLYIEEKMEFTKPKLVCEECKRPVYDCYCAPHKSCKCKNG